MDEVSSTSCEPATTAYLEQDMDRVTSTSCEPPTSACLKEFLNNKPVQTHRLTGFKVLIGRNQNAEIPIIAGNVSRNHALIEWTKRKAWCITDNRSINGVYVNGKKLDPAMPHLLKHKNRITLGPPNMVDRYFDYYDSSREAEKFLQTAIEVDLARPGCSTSFHAANNSIRTERRSLRKRVLRSQVSSSEEKKRCTDSSSDSSLEERVAAFDSLLKKNEELDERIKRILNESDERLNGAHESFKECSASLLSKTNLDTDLISWSDWSGDDLTQNISAQSSPDKKKQNHRKKASNSSDDNLQNSQKTSPSNEELLKLRERVTLLEKELKDRDQAKVELEQQLKVKESLLKEQKKEKGEIKPQAKVETAQVKTLQEKINSEVANQFGQVLESELTCVICTELFIRATTLDCSHTFCQDCLATWKKSQRVCPICRAPVHGATHSLVIDGFIEKLVEKLSPEDQAKRKKVLADRFKPVTVQKRPRRKRGRATRTRAASRAPSPPPIIELLSQDHHYTDLDVEIDPIEIMLGFRENEFIRDLDEIVDSDESALVEGFGFYGGYGRCYNCGRTGHWANGCPDV